MGRPKLKKVSLEEIKNREGSMHRHALYNTWRGMLERCHSQNSTAYSRYGSKGIFVFEKWRNKSRNPKTKRWSIGFCLFLEYIENNLGEKPEGYSLDRIVSSLGYQPGNLRWANASLQRKNQKNKNSTGFKYVYPVTGSSSWQAEYKLDKKRIYVGVFKTKEEAYYAALSSKLELSWVKSP
jgi:hypothetical protein